MKMKFYIAGASAEMDQIEKFMDHLRICGHEITLDWCAHIRQVGVASPDDPEIRVSSAKDDLKGVALADIFWLVQPATTSTSTGAWVELGSALTLKRLRHESETRTRPYIVVSGPNKKCIFADADDALADMRFETHEEALHFFLTGKMHETR
jgi:hypothetical protein